MSDVLKKGGGIVNIPNIVRIGSCDYKVEQTDNTLVLENKVCYGVIDYDKHLIELKRDLGDKQQMELTFLHELFHGMVRERGLELDNEELVVDELAKVLHQVIRDNKEIFTA